MTIVNNLSFFVLKCKGRLVVWSSFAYLPEDENGSQMCHAKNLLFNLVQFAELRALLVRGSMVGTVVRHHDNVATVLRGPQGVDETVGDYGELGGVCSWPIDDVVVVVATSFQCNIEASLTIT